MSQTAAQRPFRAVYRFFRSLKLAVVLILSITALSGAATLIPQGRESAYYLARYGAFGQFLVTFGVDKMFTSLLFLVPIALFFVNLSVCAIHRLVTSRARKKRRYGPDIIHVGLLVLMVGALLTFYGRTEDSIQMRVGESAEVDGGYVVTLDDFRFERYADGRPMEWVSVVSVTLAGEVIEESVAIEVNSALKLGPLKLYQSGYGLDEGLVLEDQEGTQFWLVAGDVIPLENGTQLVAKSIETAQPGIGETVLFEIWDNGELTGTQKLAAGTAVGSWVIREVVSSYFTGLQVVHDPGYRTVLIALIMLTLGLFLTYIQKIGDNNI